ncbi:MAG: hypothetical protein HY014_04420 [Acidobacteria bacterium]|nr:hypothetical protein [Acidobacteriota bacterium]MBI3487397.1 hypothetical protein [Acidobacteriota bacterium]
MPTDSVTADPQVRFHLPVELGQAAEVTGQCRLHKGPIHHMTASLKQGGKVKTTARTRFFETRMA